MGDDFRNVADSKIMNPAVWNAKTDAESAALSATQLDHWRATFADGSGNPDNDPEFVDFVPPNGGSSDAPIITGVSPQSGPPGTQVTLTGLKFLGHGNIQPPNTLEFNNSVPGRSASFSIISDTVIKCTVPDGAIDGRIALHSYDPTAGDVITLSAVSFDVTSGSVPPPPPSPADPSVELHWDTFDISTGGGSGPILSGALKVHASQPMENVIIDAVLGQGAAGSGLPVGFYAYGHYEQTNPGTSKQIVINTGITAIGEINPPPLISQGQVWVKATFKIGSKIKTVQKRAKARIKRPFVKGVVVHDQDEFQVVIVPPAPNPIPDFWNEKLFVAGTVNVIVKRGTAAGGSFTAKMSSAQGQNQSTAFAIPAGRHGVGGWLTAKTENNFGPIDAWKMEVLSGGNIKIKGAGDGVIRTYVIPPGYASSLLPMSHGGGMSHGQIVVP